MLQNCGPEGLDVEHMFASVTQATIRVTHPRSAATQALAALDAATDPARRGPALLVVPIQHGTFPALATRTERAPIERRSTPPLEVVAETCELLANAERPLIVLGAGCRPYAASLRRLLDAFDIPFVTTPRAKGVVSEVAPTSTTAASAPPPTLRPTGDSFTLTRTRTYFIAIFRRISASWRKWASLSTRCASTWMKKRPEMAVRQR
jgi:thiamine pyrophosphate-dependent acetolactate synthase large subunit-like protein